MHHIALLECGANCAMQSVLQEQVALPFHDVGEQVAEEGRILIEELIQVQLRFRGYEVVETHLCRRNLRPGALS